LRIFKPIVSLFTRKGSRMDADGRRSLLGHKKYLAHVESNVPLEIILFLSSYLSWLLKKGLLTPTIANAITTNIGTLQECSVNLQRIRNTPLPFAYQAHLRMSLWLYLLFLPVSRFLLS
jgi:putative membrane protein